MATPTTYGPYDIANLQNGQVNPSQLQAGVASDPDIAIGVQSIDTVGGTISSGVVTGGTLTITFKDVLPSTQKEAWDGSTSQDPSDPPGAGSRLALHDAQPTPVDVSKTEIVNKSLQVETRKPDGVTYDRVYSFSVNFCDKTTWLASAVKVVDEAVGTGDGTTTVFQIGHGSGVDTGERILDFSHGKVSDENNATNHDGEYRTMGSGYTVDGPLSGYVPIIAVGGAEKIERPYGAASGSDYEIDYHKGELTFYEAPADGVAITAPGYYYVPADGCGYVAAIPPAGKKYLIDRIEVQATSDVVLNDSLINNVFLGTPPGGFPVRRPTVVKNMYDMVNWAQGSFAQIPAQGGSLRGLPLAVNIHRVEYVTAIPLLSSQSVYLRIYLENGIEFGGTWATVVIYGMDEDE